MTETRENAPDLVLVPREPTEAMTSAGIKNLDEMLMGDAEERVSCASVYRAMLAAAPSAAPIVPSPAYGVKEALEPIIAVLNSMEESAVEFLRRTQPGDAASMTDAEIASLVHPDESRCFTDGSQHKAKYITVSDLRRARTAYDALSSAPVEEADAKAGARQQDSRLMEALHEAAVNLAARPRGLRGPFPIDHELIERLAATPPASTIPSEPEAGGGGRSRAGG